MSTLRLTYKLILILPVAVRNGDLDQFNDVLKRYGTQFQSEKTYTLIIRLRHNVIKTGIRMISLSYSRSEGREIGGCGFTHGVVSLGYL